MGRTRDGQLLAVCHTDIPMGDDTNLIRIISARPATRNERHQYESGA